LFAAKAYLADPYLENAPAILARLCQTSVDLKDFDDAYHWCREGRRRFPKRASFMSSELLLLASVASKPEPDTAWRIALDLLNALPERLRLQQEPEVLMDVAASLARAGLADSARAVIGRARSLEYGSRSAVDYREAHARLQLGESEEALRLLRRYLEAEPGERDYIAADWWWEPLHEDPRFKEMVGEVQ
jgi:tetratricopeptide (TPR) repeat protein